MVNQDFEKFNQEQKKHKSRYLTGANKPKIGNEEQNDSRHSGISVGAEGRNVRSTDE
jgi:hypothetical protein